MACGECHTVGPVVVTSISTFSSCSDLVRTAGVLAFKSLGDDCWSVGKRSASTTAAWPICYIPSTTNSAGCECSSSSSSQLYCHPADSCCKHTASSAAATAPFASTLTAVMCHISSRNSSSSKSHCLPAVSAVQLFRLVDVSMCIHANVLSCPQRIVKIDAQLLGYW